MQLGRLGHFLHIEEKGKENQGGDKQRKKAGSLFAYRREWKREPGGVISSERRVGHFLHIEEKGKENQGGDKQRNKASAEGAE